MQERSVAKHPFLSDEWLAAVDALVETHGAEAPPGAEIVMNLTITETPFGAERELHVGAADGRGHWGLGHAGHADITMTTDYATAREIFLAVDPATGLTAFMDGRVRLQGDLARLFAVQAAAAAAAADRGGPSALQLAVRDVTE
jgi:SCP-2 sterol transfer family protein